MVVRVGDDRAVWKRRRGADPADPPKGPAEIPAEEGRDDPTTKSHEKMNCDA
jgi:hypothetical protein